MKKLHFTIILCLFFYLIGKATPYYYSAAVGADITNVNNWWSGAGYSGTHPSGFTSGNVYNITGTGLVTLVATLTMGGTLQVGDGANVCTFTIPSGYKVTGTVAVSANATLSIANSNNPTFGTLATGSTVIFSGTTAQTVPTGTYSYLSITNTTATVSAGGNITVGGGINILNGATLDMISYALTNNGTQYLQQTTSGGLQNTTSVNLLSYNSSIVIGQQVGGSYIANGTTVSAVSQNIFATTTTSSTGSTNPILVASATGIVVGESVSGTNIPTNTTVTAISGTSVTLSNAPTATITGNITFSGTSITLSQAATAASGNTGTYYLVFGSATSGTGNLNTQNTSGSPFSTGKTWTFTVNFNNATGGQTVPWNSTFYGLTINNTSGTDTAGNSFSVYGNLGLPNTGSKLDMKGSSVYCTSSSFNTSGIGLLLIENTGGSGAINTNSIGQTWRFTVEFDGTTGSQTTPKGNNTFTNLIIANPNGVGLYANATITGTLTINSGCTLNTGISSLSGNFSTSGTGKLTTSSTSSAPLPSGLNYSFEVDYNSTSAQTIVAGNYNILNASNTGSGARNLGSGTISVSSSFIPGATGSYSANSDDTLNLTYIATLPTLGSNNASYANLSITTGIITAPSLLTITGAFTISGGTFIAPSGYFYVGGNWNNNGGTFTNNNGTVAFNGTSQHINGSSIFYNLTKSVTSPDVFTFQSGMTQTITDSLTLNGTSGNLLEVYSSSIASQANINPSGTRVISYIAVSGSDNINSTAISASNSVNNGNNTNWTLSAPNTTGDLEVIPNTWSTVNGTLAIDTNHYRLGARSVAWNWNANDTLKITGIGFDSTLLTNYSYNTLDVNIYNTSLRSDSIHFLFYNRNNTLRYQFSVQLNYKGWYETIRSYRYNLTRLGTPSGLDSLMKVYIVAPHTGSGQLNFDNVNWIYAATQTPMTLPMPDSLVKAAGLGGGSYPIYDGDSIYKLQPAAIPIPSAIDISDFLAVKTSFMSDIYAAFSVTPALLGTANAYYNSQCYSLNSDGTAKGKAIEGLFVPEGPYANFTANFQIFAYAWYQNNDTVSLNKAIIMLRYLLDNGNYAGGPYRLGTYDSPPFYTSLALLANKIYSIDTTLYNNLSNYVKWDLYFGAAWMPANVYSPVSTDNPRMQIMGYLGYPLVMIRDTATAIQNLRGFNNFLSNFMTPNDGHEDNIKMDGSCFHHLANYYSYTQPCYVYLSQWLYHLRNTQFKPDSVTYKRVRDVVYNYFLQENTLNSSYSNPGAENTSDFFSLNNSYRYLSRLANLGKGITGSGPDYILGCAYNRIFSAYPDSTLPTTTYPAEAFPSGFTQMNYGCFGLYRKTNWLSTIKMLSTDFWGVQCGLLASGTRRDIYSRYAPYGSIDILYNSVSANQMNNSFGTSPLGYTSDVFEYTNGYDHRFPNGTTTVVISMDSLADNQNYGDEYAYTGSIAGSLSFQNRPSSFSFKTRGDYGLSAMKFQQAPYGFNEACKGSQRDTTFKFEKSWFAFDTIIVCLGSGIQNKNSINKTATNLFQLTDSAQTIYVNGLSNNTFPYNTNFLGTGPYQLITPYNTGYYVKSNDSLHITVSKQQFTLNLNGTNGSSSGNWVNAWLDHGTAPTNKSYEYVIIPSTNSTALSNFATSMGNPTTAFYTIKEQDSIMHRIYYKPKNIQAYAIFQAVTNISDTSSFIKSANKSCYAMGINQGDSMLSLTVVNPNLNLRLSNTVSEFYPPEFISYSTLTPLTITLRGSWNFLSNDTDIHIVSSTDTTTTIQINTQYGLPSDAVFQAANTTWNGASWSNGTPNSAKKAIINANLTNSATFSAMGLTINSGDTIFNTGSVQITSGNLINNGVIDNVGTTSLNGSAAQTISGIGTISNLIVNNASGATISIGSNTLNIKGVLTLVNGQLNTNGNLVLVSDSNSTGTLAEYGINGNSGSLSGNVTIQRYISPKTVRRYSFIGSPVSQTIRNAWQQQIYITGAGTGGTPCGITSGDGGNTDRYNSNGFDVTQTQQPSIRIYNAAKVNGIRWISIPNTESTSLTPGKGYCINIRGNRNSGTVTCFNQLETATPTPPEPVILSTTGTIFTGAMSVSLYDTAVSKYNLLANPYPCPISYTAFKASNTDNIYNKMWTYSPFGNGNYTTYSNGVIANGALGYDGSSGDRIASGQAFFVEATPAGSNGVATFQETHKISGTIPNTQYFGTTAKKLLRLGLKTTTDTLLDEIVVSFNSNGSKTYNSNWDAASFDSASQVIKIIKGTYTLAISTLPDVIAEDTVQLGLSSSTTGTFRLLFSDYQGIDSSVSIILKDNFLGINYDIRASQVYDFNVTNDTASQGDNRFEIVFHGGSTLAVRSTLDVTSIKATASMIDKGAIITWSTVDESGESYYAVEKSTDAKTFIQIGEVTAKNTATDSYNFTDNNLSAVNYYRIRAISETGAVAYSNIARLTTYNSQLTTFNLYPNPLSGTKLVLAMENVATGGYLICFYNAIGQRVNEQSIVHSGGSGSYALTLNSNLASGIYLVSIRDKQSDELVYHGDLLVR